MNRFRLSRLILGIALGLACLPVATARADEVIHEQLREFYRIGKYVLFISGEEQSDARIYHSRRAGAFLIVGSSYNKPLLVRPVEKTISAVPEDKVAERPDKGMDIVADAVVEDLGAIGFDKGGMTVDLEGLVARLQPQPNLLGAKNAEEVLLHSPEYGQGADAYQPNGADIRRIQANERKVEIVVFFGSWCTTCRRLLPRILGVDKAIGGSNVTITYYGLPKGSAMRNDPEARKAGIQRIPTGVVMVDGKAVGEISSRAWNRPESALASVLGG
ncbi:MAG: thioredoxin family protein [Planctomycetota bacterium]|nr:thioredoxin family protein [Planctomycetota bacterium]